MVVPPLPPQRGTPPAAVVLAVAPVSRLHADIEGNARFGPFRWHIVIVEPPHGAGWIAHQIGQAGRDAVAREAARTVAVTVREPLVLARPRTQAEDEARAGRRRWWR